MRGEQRTNKSSKRMKDEGEGGSWKMLKTRSLSVKNVTTTARKAIALRRAESRHLKRTRTTSALPLSHKVLEPSSTQFNRWDYLRGSSIRTPSKAGKAEDLERKIEVEMRLKEGAQNLMEHVPMDHSQQSAEASKNLIVSQHKMAAYKQELDTRNVLTAIPKSCQKEPSRGKLAISEMRLPLMWRERDHFRNKGDSRQFAMFAVFRVGSDICDTALIYGVDRTCTDVAFPDILIFENVLPGFQVFVTLYSVLLDPSRLVSGSASLRLRRRLKGSLGRSLGHRWGSTMRREQENPVDGSGDINPCSVQFRPVATAVLGLRDAGEAAKTHDFQLHSIDEPCCPSLYGHFCCRLVIQPGSSSDSLVEGEMGVQMKDRRFPGLWSRLREAKLSCWRSRNEVLSLPPIIHVPISPDCITQMGRKGDCLILSVPLMAGYAQYVLVPEKKDLSRWKDALETQILDCKLWGCFATKCVGLGHESQEWSKPYFLRPSCRNLYDEISIADDVQMCNSEGLKPPRKRPSIQNVFSPSLSGSLTRASGTSTGGLPQQKPMDSGGAEGKGTDIAPSFKVLMRKKQTDGGTSRKIRTRKSLSSIFSRGNKESRL